MNIATQSYQIPEHQFNLEYGLTQIGLAAPNHQAVMAGGTALFRILDQHADKIMRPV